MSAPKISVFVITLNEGKNMERCLHSVSWADEIVIVDSLSTDNTLEICKRYTKNVHSREFSNYADQKNHALSLTTGRWAFSVDADEEVTEELRRAILEIIEKPDALDAYRIPRHSFMFQREFHYSGTQTDKPIRLFKRDKAHYAQPIHEVVEIQGTTGCLTAHLNHHTYDGVSDYMKRFNRYTSMEAEFLKEKQHRLSAVDYAVKPLAMFLKLYVFQQGFRDGFEGFLFCFLSGCYVLVKYAKLRELTKESLQDAESLCCHS